MARGGSWVPGPIMRAGIVPPATGITVSVTRCDGILTAAARRSSRSSATGTPGGLGSLADRATSAAVASSSATADLRRGLRLSRRHGQGGGRCRRTAPELEPRVAGGRDLIAPAPVHVQPADIRQEHPRLAGDVGAHIPAV